MTINVRINGRKETREITRKVGTGFHLTHNRDGKYTKMWAIDANGVVYTNSPKGYRIAQSHDVPPPSLFA